MGRFFKFTETCVGNLNCTLLIACILCFIFNGDLLKEATLCIRIASGGHHPRPPVSTWRKRYYCFYDSTEGLADRDINTLISNGIEGKK